MQEKITAEQFRKGNFGQKMSKGKPVQHESELQKLCVRWFRIKYPKLLLFSVPNGGSRNAIEAKRLKDEGVVPGVSDLILFYANQGYNALCIEMKYGKNKQSPNQLKFQEYCDKHNYQYVVCYSFDEFEGIITRYLNKL